MATLAVDGYSDLMRAFALADRAQKHETRKAFRKVGEIVRADAVRRMSPINAGSAAGFRVAIRQRGIAVEQSRRKTTGRHPEYGALQMRRALLPARSENVPETMAALETAMDEVADVFSFYRA